MKKNKLVLGTAQFGLNYGINNLSGKIPRREVFNILEKAVALDIQMLDTADGYGDASQTIGEFIKTTGTRFLVNTKFKFEPAINVSNQLQISLDVLATDQVNTYFFHDFTDIFRYPEAIDSLLLLKSHQKIQNIGVSVYTNQEFEKAINLPDVDVIQIPFNLLDNFYQRGLLIKRAKGFGKQIQVRSIFLQGLFFKSINEYPPYLFKLRAHAESLNKIRQESGRNMESLCMGYVLAQPDIDHAIFGVDNCNQLVRNVSHLEFPLELSIVEKINQLAVQEAELLYPINWK